MLDGVAAIVPEIRVEVLLDEGTRLVLREPFGPAGDDDPGAIRFAEGDELAPDRERIRLTVTNRGEHPIRVSSHFPFWRSNAHLEFDRAAAEGSGSTCPPATRSDGRPARRTRSTSSATEGRGSPCRGLPARRARDAPRSHGRRPVRLGDTDLWIRIERDLTDPADQALWGYAKNWRSGMVQHDRATTESELDTIVASAVVLDPVLGVLKADIGIKDGGSPGSAAPATPTSPTASTSRSAQHVADPVPRLIATPGAVDSHVHLLSPRLVPVALSAGVTTLITAGFEDRRGGCSAPWRPSSTSP